MHFVFIFDNLILMMHTNSTKCYFLILSLDLIQKSPMSKSAVVSMVMLHNAIHLRQNLFESFNCKNHLVGGKISHEMIIDKITDMITERCASLNAMIC
jgi:hypothetical protein